MYAVLNTLTGKYLHRFSGSLNYRFQNLYYKAAKTMPEQSTYPDNPILVAKAEEALYSASTKADAKLYMTIGGVKNSLGSDMPAHLKIVEVTIK